MMQCVMMTYDKLSGNDLLVEVVLRTVLFDNRFVRFLNVLLQNDVSVLAYSLHAGLHYTHYGYINLFVFV